MSAKDKTPPTDTPDAPDSEAPTPDLDSDVAVPADEAALLVEDPDGAYPYSDGIPQDYPPEAATMALGFMALRMADDLPDAPRTRAEQFAFLRDAHDGAQVWKALCLSLTRQAPGLPALHASAAAAAAATPGRYRVRDVRDLRRGMVAYFDDPTDDNKFGHSVTVAGWADSTPTDDLADLLTWTNDAKRPGGVDLVRASFFPDRWGDAFQFGATMLNGFDLPGYENGRQKVPSLGGALDRAISDVRRAMAEQRAKGHPRVVAALARDLAELRETRKQFP